MLTPHKMAFDDSREGRLMRRYEQGCKQFFLRCLDEVRTHREERAKRAKQGLGGGRYQPAWTWFHELAKGTPLELEDRVAAMWKSISGQARNPKS